MLHDEGMVRIGHSGEARSYTYFYHLKDHLGNTRVEFQANPDNSYQVTQRQSYYPFGLRFEVAPAGENEYLYNGKELQEDLIAGRSLGWYDYGFRYYDATIARFTTVDPLTEKNHNQSGFLYAVNNPIKYIDYMGLDSAQRAQAIEASNIDVNAKKGDNPSEYKQSDCSTTFNSWTTAGGESYKHTDENGKWTDGSGAATILTNVEETSKANPVVGVIEDENDVIPGNGYIWKKIKEDGTVSYHIGLVVGVERDDDDSITEVTINHSEEGRGYIQDKFNPKDKKVRWVRREHSYFRWDSKADIVSGKSIPKATITAPPPPTKLPSKPIGPISIN
jgi:RHS repeat-associated protein